MLSTALAVPHPDPTTLVDTGTTVGTHGGHIVHDPATASDWLFKEEQPTGEFLPDLDVAVNQIATQSGLETAQTFLTQWDGKKASAQAWNPPVPKVRSACLTAVITGLNSPNFRRAVGESR